MIDELASAALKAEPPVRDVTGLVTNGAIPAARVIDRQAWVRAAAESLKLARDWINTPAADFGPAELAAAVRTRREG